MDRPMPVGSRNAACKAIIEESIRGERPCGCEMRIGAVRDIPGVEALPK